MSTILLIYIKPLGDSDPPLAGPYKNTNKTCDDCGECTCWIPELETGSCHGVTCNADGNDGLCLSKLRANLEK